MTTSLQKGVEGPQGEEQKEGEGFVLQGRHFFFTYPQTGLTMESCLEQLMIVFEIVDYIIAQEDHTETLGQHLHVYFSVPKRMRIRGTARMHLKDKDGKTVKGNYTKCRSSLAAQRYCKKDGRFITNMKFNLLRAAVAAAMDGDAKEAFSLITEARPDLIITSGGRIKQNMAMLAFDNEPIKKGFTDFVNIPPIMKDWNPKRQALWLIGPSGVGKTEYAKSLYENPIIVSHADQLKSLEGHDCVIFDDFNISHWHREAGIHITDLANDRGINVKHGCVLIRAGFPRIFCSNKWIWPEDDTGAIKRRVFCVQVNKPMYVEDPAEESHYKARDDWQVTAVQTGNGPMMPFDIGPFPGN